MKVFDRFVSTPAVTAMWVLSLSPAGFAQLPPNPAQKISQNETPRADMPVFRVTVVDRVTKTVNYRHRGGATKINFAGTPLLPNAKGEAKVESKQGYIEIEVEFDKLEPATKYGPEYLTYVMWAITPEGRASNLGEVLLNGTSSKLNVTSDLQAFALLVTAEPYFAVTQPSDVVVLENVVRPDTLGKVEVVEAKYELLKRGTYTFNLDPNKFQRNLDPKVPLELYEARNAVTMARAAGAERYGGESFQKAATLLSQAEDYQNRKAGRKPVTMTARQAAQTAEDARLITFQRIEQERQENEKRASADREAAANAAAQEETRRRAAAEADRQSAEQARLRAEADRQAAQRASEQAEAARLAAQRQAEQIKADAERARMDAEAAKAAALASAAAEAAKIKADAEREKAELRARLQQQLNVVLETRDSARGLIVNISDVLFDTAQHTLRTAAREKLAKVSGIVLAHPGLELAVEGHTDSVGSDEYNQGLSERRAESVRAYLVQQGLQSQTVTAKGFGETTPVASNDTAAGRQQNRRVEIVVSGDPIRTSTTTTTTAVPAGSVR